MCIEFWLESCALILWLAMMKGEGRGGYDEGGSWAAGLVGWWVRSGCGGELGKSIDFLSPSTHLCTAHFV